MAKINSKRPECAAYNGKDARFVRDVTEADGSSYNPLVDQVIVEIDGVAPMPNHPQGGKVELYFFANEVELTPDEAKANAKAGADRSKAASEASAATAEQIAGKRKQFAETKRKGSPIPVAAPAPAPIHPSGTPA